jgi:hypothetical protein
VETTVSRQHNAEGLATWLTHGDLYGRDQQKAPEERP